jgi:3-phenylpropionate/cinnamic acid dioxygenase small subunit
MSDEMAARVRRLEDLLEIQQLFVDYGRHLDAGAFREYAALFADDGEILLGPLGRAKGPEEIHDLLARTLDGQVGQSLHIISSPRISLDGDRATSEVMWTVLRRNEKGMPVVDAVGRHRDELVRERGRWRFRKRKGYVDIPAALAAR